MPRNSPRHAKSVSGNGERKAGSQDGASKPIAPKETVAKVAALSPPRRQGRSAGTALSQSDGAQGNVSLTMKSKRSKNVCELPCREDPEVEILSAEQVEKMKQTMFSKKKSKAKKVVQAKELNDTEAGFPMPLTVEQAKQLQFRVGLERPTKNALLSVLMSFHEREQKRYVTKVSRQTELKATCPIPGCAFLCTAGMRTSGTQGEKT